MRTVSIYTPEGYDEETRSYPVVYCLHGCACGEVDVHWLTWNYFNLRGILDGSIGAGIIQPVIVVHPDGCNDVEWSCGSYWTNSELYGAFEDYVVEDLVGYVDDNYRTIEGRDYRVLVGHSMGGYGVMKVALNNPEVFGATGAMAGVVDLMVNLTRNQPLVCSEYPSSPRDYNPDQGDASGSMFTKSGSFSPNLANPPYYVDFPYDPVAADCDLIDSVVDRWALHDPPYLARQYMPVSEEYPLCIWLGCGTEDPRIIASEALAESLDVLGLPYQFDTWPGDHLDTRFDLALGYLLNPNVPCGIVGVDETQPDANVTMRVLPNPSRSNATFEFALPQVESVALVVYDISGRLVRSVFDGELAAGPHSLTWDGTSDAGSPVADGVYFVALRTGAGTEVIRTVRLK